MTKTDVEKIVKAWQERLHLGEWTIEVAVIDGTEINKEGHVAQIQRRVHSLDARVTVATRRDKDEVEATIIHEMLHLVLGEMLAAFRHGVDQLSDQAAAVAQADFDTAEERTVSRLTFALAEMS